ncbi:unnamed protein product [Rhodiola kirilowii]
MRRSERLWRSTILLLFMLFSSSAAATLCSLDADDHQHDDCRFLAIFNFGDSNSDTGGLAATFSAPKTPFGQTYFGMPQGRLSDGRLVIDFIAESLGIPYLSAYLDSLGTNFAQGANFATSASPITPATSVMPVGKFSPFDLDVQYWQFTEFKNRSQIIRNRGGIYKDMMPKEEYFGRALYTFDIGQNDFGERFFAHQTMEEVTSAIPLIIDTFSSSIKKFYETGARSFWIHNTGPIGCLPYILDNLPNIQLDSAGCAKPYNDVCQHFNHELKTAVVDLRKSLPGAAITYVDVYSVKYSLYEDPKTHGFEKPLVACCGYGGKYNYNGKAGCGETMDVNGTEIFIGSCKDVSVRVNWEGIHYTEAANKYIFHQIATGKFSDPPIPLKMACKSSF